jgi:hypothetical protein
MRHHRGEEVMRRERAIHDVDDYYFCGLAAQGANAEVDAGYVADNNYEDNPSEFAAPMTGDWVTVQARTTQPPGELTELDCVGSRGAVTGTTSYDADADAGGAIGVRTNDVDASFDYIFVVEVPAPTAS